MHLKSLLKAWGIAACALTSVYSHAATLGYNLDLPDSEIVKLMEEIEAQGLIGPDEVSIDSLRHEGDKLAYDQAIDAIAKRIQWAVFELGQLKRQVIRYSVIVNQANLTEDKVAYITDTSVKVANEHYHRAMWALAGNVFEESDVLDRCVSEVCVIEVSDAFESMTAFAESINQGFNFKNLDASTKVFWRFEKPLLRASFSRAFKNMVPDNKDHNAYKVIAAGLFTPISVAGVTTVDVLKAAGSAIFNPRYRNIKLSVRKEGIDFNRLRDEHERIFKTQYREAAGGKRAANYEKIRTEPSPSLGERPGLDPYYWLPMLAGSEAQKRACSQLASVSARDYYNELDLRVSQAKDLAVLGAEVERFLAELSPEQKNAIANYASGYAQIAADGDTQKAAALDVKMSAHLFNMLSPTITASRQRFIVPGACPGGFDYTGPKAEAPAVNSGPAYWASQAECYSYSYYNTYRKYAPATKASFLEVKEGRVKFWACGRNVHGEEAVTSCQGVDLASGARTGQTVLEALRDPAIVAHQGHRVLKQLLEEYVKESLKECFVAAK